MSAHMTALTPAGDGFTFEHDGVWTVRPGVPGGWVLRTPGGVAVGWFCTPEDCRAHVTAPAGDGVR